MYGKKIGFKTDDGGIIRPSLYVETSDDFGNANNKNIDVFQRAFDCCGDHLPKYGQPNEVWVCLVCERIWIARHRNAWALTHLSLVSEAERDLAALDSYRLWNLAIGIFAGTLILSTIAALFGSRLLGIDTSVFPSVGVGVAVFAVGITATLVVLSRWWKRLKDYTLSVPLEIVHAAV